MKKNTKKTKTKRTAKTVTKKDLKKKGTTAWILLIICLVVLGFLSIVFFRGLDTTDDEDFVSDLTEMGSELYAIYYYDEVSKTMGETELKDYLKKFEEKGLKFDLEQISKYNDSNKKKIDEFIRKNKKCNKNSSMVIIYPKEPFTSTDFTTEVQLSCER